MLGRRRRRWTNIEPTLGERFVFGILSDATQITPILRCYNRASVADGNPASNQHRVNVLYIW